jgi:peptide-methionine (S)-S-oxide reductase
LSLGINAEQKALTFASQNLFNTLSPRSMKTVILSILLGALIFPMTTNAETKTETIVLGGGCFWCLDATFQLIPGVKAVVSGYAGGSTPSPSYEDVCTGSTGHAEVVKIEYNPAQVTLEKLLDFFWTIHDPTTLNAQGHDHGTQYRSIILYQNDAQKNVVEKSKAAAQAKFSDPIVTEIVPLKNFYRAEEYHQDYFRKNPNSGYCRLVVQSKVDKAKKVLTAH